MIQLPSRLAREILSTQYRSRRGRQPRVAPRIPSSASGMPFDLSINSSTSLYRERSPCCENCRSGFTKEKWSTRVPFSASRTSVFTIVSETWSYSLRSISLVAARLTFPRSLAKEQLTQGVFNLSRLGICDPFPLFLFLPFSAVPLYTNSASNESSSQTFLHFEQCISLKKNSWQAILKL